MGNVPWFWPGVVLSIVVATLAGGRLGRSLGIGRAHGAGLVVSLGIILSATLTPFRDALVSGAVGSGVCDLSRIGLPPLRDLLGLNDTTLNLVLFSPLGAAIAMLPRGPQRRALLVAALIAPFTIETIQLLAPVLARGCQSSDVVDNLTGLVVGVLLGTAWRVRSRRRAEGSTRPGGAD